MAFTYIEVSLGKGGTDKPYEASALSIERGRQASVARQPRR